LCSGYFLPYFYPANRLIGLAFSDQLTNCPTHFAFLFFPLSVPGVVASIREGMETPLEECTPESDVHW